MNEKDNFALVPRPPGAIEKAEPGAKRILSGMVTDTLDLATSKEVAVSDEQVESWFQTGVKYHAKGLGSLQDFVEAAKWYRKAAEQNHAGAQNNLGFCYYYGHGVPKDSVEAVKWFRKAADQAEQGNATAQHDLGYRYAKGLGVTKDKVEAAKWYRKAAEQGHAEAQCALGVCYAGGVMGTIMGKNLVEAVKWLNLALAQGFEQAKTILSILEQQMTPEQIAEARRLSGEFEPHTESRQAISNQFGIEGVSS
jgi:tetratricopeptide (TPR) repeat protein